jgi:hypothetical protein
MSRKFREVDAVDDGDDLLSASSPTFRPGCRTPLFQPGSLDYQTSHGASSLANEDIPAPRAGTTVFVADSTMTGDTPALEVFSTAQDGAPQLLTADAAQRGIAVQMASTGPAAFAIGDAVLLYSNREVDTESYSRPARAGKD